MKKRLVLYHLLKALLIFLWCYTALSKLFEMERFTGTLSLIPFWGISPGITAYTLVGTELLTALLLCFKRSSNAGLFLSLFLLIVFTVYIVLMLLFAPKLPCSCGGVIQELGWKWHIVFNLAYIGICSCSLFLYNKIIAQSGDAENL